MIFARKIPDYIIRQRDRGQPEAKTSRPRPKLRRRGRNQNFGLEAWPQGLNITGSKWNVMHCTGYDPRCLYLCWSMYTMCGL